MDTISHYISQNFKVQHELLKFCDKIENSLKDRFLEIDKIAEYNQLKILNAMQQNKLSEIHFTATTGYGYNDLGRDTLEKIYADVFNAEDALVRPQIISGTHAINIALSGNLRPGDEILSPVGIPYDTLQGVIGIRPEKGSLKEFGIVYKQVDLLSEDKFDFDGIKKAITDKTKLVTIQRSKGYIWRKSFSIDEVKQLIDFIKSINKNIICMIDNCYCEFVDILEPSDVGADLVAGSLIKNPGGGLSPIGGYIVGKKEFVENAACRLTSPGLGKEVGATLGTTQSMIQGLFFAPQVVSGSLKGAVFASKIFEALGFDVLPHSNEKRADIVQAIKMESAENVIAFCKGIQKGAPVDSFVSPEPWDMPGYDCKVIMAAGAFISGASIELSADAPIKPPYNVFLQGGLSWHHAKIGIIIALQTMLDKNLISIKNTD